MSSPAEPDFGILLGGAYAAFTEWLRAEMGSSGFDDLGPSYGYVFRALGEGSMTLTELAAGLGMTTQGAAKIVAAMTEGGYVRSTPDPTDGRAKRLALDDRGRRALRRARALHASYQRRLLRRLGEQRVADLRAALSLVGESGGVDPAARVLRPM
jgi:DNA-binding MarR family transcriptional regulator